MEANYYLWLKLTHISLAATSVGLFTLRLLLWEANGRKPSGPALRVAPHLIDTLLLATGATLAWFWHLSPFSANWFGLKLLLVLAYIGLGFVAFRFSRTPGGRRIAAGAALLVAACIASLALTKPF